MTAVQQYQKGDLVKVFRPPSPDPCYIVFPYDCRGIIIGSYNDQYGEDNDGKEPDEHSLSTYTVFIEDQGEVSWFDLKDLTIIEKNRLDLLEQWQSKLDAFIEEKSNLDWIFENSEEVIKKPYGASAQALASCFGLTNLWGKSGEGIVYEENKQMVMGFAESFLKNKDKQGWLDLCEHIKSGTLKIVRDTVKKPGYITWYLYKP